MFFSAEFDPIRLVSQIILLQALFYFTSCTFLLLSHLLLSTPLHIALLLSSKALTQTDSSWAGLVTFLLASAALPFFVSRTVVRTKLCLDFVTSLYGFHILVVTLYDDAIPRSLFFWLLTIATIIVVVILSEQLCMQLELSDIPLDFLSAGGPASGANGKGKGASNNNGAKGGEKTGATTSPLKTTTTTTTTTTTSTTHPNQASAPRTTTTVSSLLPSHSRGGGTRVNAGSSATDTDGDESDGDETDERRPMRPYR